PPPTSNSLFSQAGCDVRSEILRGGVRNHSCGRRFSRRAVKCKPPRHHGDLEDGYHEIRQARSRIGWSYSHRVEPWRYAPRRRGRGRCRATTRSDAFDLPVDAGGRWSAHRDADERQRVDRRYARTAARREAAGPNARDRGTLDTRRERPNPVALADGGRWNPLESPDTGIHAAVTSRRRWLNRRVGSPEARACTNPESPNHSAAISG